MKTVIDKQKDAFDALKEGQGYSNSLEVPRVEKVVISSGIGSVNDADKIKLIEDRLSLIAGQRPVPTRAKKSIASFDVRAGDVAGYKVTLRGRQARSFLDRLIHIVLPRTKDFRGIDPESADEMGNITIGVPEHTAFPATSDEEISDVFGMAVTVVTSADSAEEAVAYLSYLGLPLQSKKDEETAE